MNEREDTGMNILELMRNRHSVRQYKDDEIEESKKTELISLIEDVNKESGLSVQAFFNEPKCFDSFMAHYGKFVNVTNYIAMVGNKKEDEKVGYYGEKIVLKCQELGLNTCWVAMTHGKSKAKIGKGQKLYILIPVGYGVTQGIPHRSKPLGKLGHSDKEEEWFTKGLQAASLAPTAMNQQKFFFELKDGIVTAKTSSGFYTKIDLGIAKCHFELASGHEVK